MAMLCFFGCHLHSKPKHGVILRGDWAIELNHTPSIGSTVSPDCEGCYEEETAAPAPSIKDQVLNLFRRDKGESMVVYEDAEGNPIPAKQARTPRRSRSEYSPSNNPPSLGPALGSHKTPQERYRIGQQPVQANAAPPAQSPGAVVPLQNLPGGSLAFIPNNATPMTPGATPWALPQLTSAPTVLTPVPGSGIATGGGMIPIGSIVPPGGMLPTGGVVAANGMVQSFPSPMAPGGMLIPPAMAQSNLTQLAISIGVPIGETQGVGTMPTMQFAQTAHPFTGQVVPGLSMSGHPQPGYPPIGYAPTGYSPGYAQPNLARQGAYSEEDYDAPEFDEQETAPPQKMAPGAIAKSSMPAPRHHAVPTKPTFERSTGLSERKKAVSSTRTAGGSENPEKRSEVAAIQQAYLNGMAVGMRQQRVVPVGYQQQGSVNNFLQQFGFRGNTPSASPSPSTGTPQPAQGVRTVVNPQTQNALLYQQRQMQFQQQQRATATPATNKSLLPQLPNNSAPILGLLGLAKDETSSQRIQSQEESDTQIAQNTSSSLSSTRNKNKPAPSKSSAKRDEDAVPSPDEPVARLEAHDIVTAETPGKPPTAKRIGTAPLPPPLIQQVDFISEEDE